MKKIILFTVIIIFIPFVIVSFFKIDKKEEINLKQMMRAKTVDYSEEKGRSL